MTNSKFLKNRINSVLISLTLLGVTLGCLGPSSSLKNCEGVIQDKGMTYIGTAAKKERAGLNACNKFCLQTDSEFDGRYRIWLNSSAGKNLAQRKNHTPTKEEAVLENRGLLDYLTKNCANRCYKEANKGKHTINIKCKK